MTTKPKKAAAAKGTAQKPAQMQADDRAPAPQAGSNAPAAAESTSTQMGVTFSDWASI